LVELCEFPQDQKWDLKYRTPRDGFKASDFHTKCDGKGQYSHCHSSKKWQYFERRNCNRLVTNRLL